MAQEPNYRWGPSPSRLFAVAALIFFILAALSAAGLMSANGHFLAYVGFACLAAAMVV